MNGVDSIQTYDVERLRDSNDSGMAFMMNEGMAFLTATPE